MVEEHSGEAPWWRSTLVKGYSGGGSTMVENDCDSSQGYS